MKKIGLFLCILACVGIAQAQFNFGIKAGVTLNSLSVDKSGISADVNPGFNVGVFARIGKKLYIQPEIAYSFSKFKFDVNSSNLIDGTAGQEASKTFKESQQGVSIPILVGYKILNLKVMNLRAFLGPEFMISTSNFSSLKDNIQDFKSKAFGVSGLVGVGVDVLMLSLDLRYSYPFTNNFVIGDEKTNFKGWVISLAWKIF